MGIKINAIVVILAMCFAAKNAVSAQFFDATLLAQVNALKAAALNLALVQGAAVEIYSESDKARLAELKVSIGMHEELSKAQTDHILALLKQHAVARTTGMNVESYSPSSVGDYSASAESRSVEIIEGQKVKAETEKEITDFVVDYNSKFTHTGDAIRSIAVSEEKKANLLDVRKGLLPVGGTTDDPENLARQVIMLGQPLPPPVMNSEAHADSPFVKFYERQRNMKNTTISVVQKILARQAQNVIPAYKAEGEWWDDLTAQYNGNVPDVDKDENGNISETSMLKLQVAARYENPNWIQSVHQENDTGLLRTFASLQALELKLKKELHYTNQDNRLLLSVLNSEEAREVYGPAIEQTRKEVIFLP
jgi:hypothetical protein